ncbi:MAG: STAS domain-containing protein [Deltaproteobacteria bacterium]|nr:STAS domain-containing protein [Deltaproteobacteria bacterium]
MFDISNAADIAILHLYGDLSLLEMELLEKAIRSFKECRHTKIVLDLARVDYLHLRAARSLLRQAEELRQNDGDLKIAHVSDQLRESLKFAGADQSLKDYASISEAILSFLKKTQGEDRLL